MKNLGRSIFLNEILVNFLRNTDEYSDDAIERKASELLKLQNKKDIYGALTPEEKRKFNKLSSFFKSSFGVSFETGNLIYPKFLKKYEMAKAAIDLKKRAYDNVVKKYIQMANNGSNYNDEDYLKFINYLKKKIVIAKASSGIQDANTKLFEHASTEKKLYENANEKPLEISDTSKTEFKEVQTPSTNSQQSEQPSKNPTDNSADSVAERKKKDAERDAAEEKARIEREEIRDKARTAAATEEAARKSIRDKARTEAEKNNASIQKSRIEARTEAEKKNAETKNLINESQNKLASANAKNAAEIYSANTNAYATANKRINELNADERIKSAETNARLNQIRDAERIRKEQDKLTKLKSDMQNATTDTERRAIEKQITDTNLQIRAIMTGEQKTGDAGVSIEKRFNNNDENKNHIIGDGVEIYTQNNNTNNRGKIIVGDEIQNTKQNKLKEYFKNLPPPLVLMGGENIINNTNNRTIMDNKNNTDDSKNNKTDIVNNLIKKHTDFNINKFKKDKDSVDDLINKYSKLISDNYDTIMTDITTANNITTNKDDIEKKLTAYSKCDSSLKNFKTQFEKINIDLGISNEKSSSSSSKKNINVINNLIGTENKDTKDVNNRNLENMKKILEEIKNTIKTTPSNNGLMFEKNISPLELYYSFNKSNDEIKQIQDSNNDDCIDLIECINKLIYNYKTILNELNIFTNTHTQKIKDLVADIEKKNKDTLQIKNNLISKKGYKDTNQDGGADYKPSDDLSKINEDFIKTNNDNFEKIKDQFNNIGKYLLRIKNQTDIDDNPTKKLLDMKNKDILKEYKSDDPINANNSIFYKAWNKYTSDTSKGDKIKEEIDDNLYQDIKVNDLDPKEVLKLTMQDRGIFTIVIFFIRIATLNIVEYFIDSGKIKDITYALLFYVIIYITILLILVLFVNIDTYKMRILFNYLNFHTNSFGILLHITSLIIFTYLIYTLIVNINFPIPNLKQDYISESDKIKLSYRLEILTMIIFLFIAIISLVV